jgi:hypothetical protein
MRFSLALLALIITLSASWAEVVTTLDGRRILLNEDGTYQVIDSARPVIIEMTEQTPYFERYAGEYGRNSMRFMPIFLNETGQTITGFRFRTVFRSAFGEEVYSFDGESNERIETDQTSSATTFYFFEDNQFIANEAYDKLLVFEASGTGTVETTVTAVVFESGDILLTEE